MKKLVFLLCLVSSPAFSQGLASESYVTDRLMAARAGDLIRKNCDEISARMFRALSQANALKQWALDAGYSDDEIDVFLKSKAEKDRIYKKADAYLASRGLNVLGWCGVGHKEIDEATFTGSLLRKN